ncbi:unnamed protein product [Lepidochelys kempii]
MPALLRRPPCPALGARPCSVAPGWCLTRCAPARGGTGEHNSRGGGEEGRGRQFGSSDASLPSGETENRFAHPPPPRRTPPPSGEEAAATLDHLLPQPPSPASGLGCARTGVGGGRLPGKRLPRGGRATCAAGRSGTPRFAAADLKKDLPRTHG